jgi:hypothetical protein
MLSFFAYQVSLVYNSWNSSQCIWFGKMKIEVKMDWRDTQSHGNSWLNLQLSMTPLERKVPTDVADPGTMARDLAVCCVTSR